MYDGRRELESRGEKFDTHLMISDNIVKRKRQFRVAVDKQRLQSWPLTPTWSTPSAPTPSAPRRQRRGCRWRWQRGRLGGRGGWWKGRGHSWTRDGVLWSMLLLWQMLPRYSGEHILCEFALTKSPKAAAAASLPPCLGYNDENNNDNDDGGDNFSCYRQHQQCAFLWIVFFQTRRLSIPWWSKLKKIYILCVLAQQGNKRRWG